MLEPSIKTLYTHASQDYLQYEAGETLRLDTDCFFGDDPSRFVVADVPVTIPAVEIEQRRYFSPMTAWSRVPAWSQTSIYAEIPILSHTIRSTCGDAPSQYRRIEYADLPESPILYLDPENPVVYEAEGVTQVSSGYVTEIYLTAPLEIEESLSDTHTRKKIYKVPDAQGTISTLYGLTVPVAWDEVDRVIKTSSAVVPSTRDGWLPASYINQSMDSTTPQAAAWGLMAAVAAGDVGVVVLIIKQLVTLAVRYGWVITRGDTGNLDLTATSYSYFGFPIFFSVFDTAKPNRFKEVSSNAHLGIAICEALDFLQNQPTLGSFQLDGKFYDFVDLLKLLLRGLTRFCAGAISPATNLVAYKEDNGHYTFEAPSLSASYLTDVFLNYSLNFLVEDEVRLAAAKLHYYLSNYPLSVENPLYSNAVECSYRELNLLEHPSFLQDTDTPVSIIRAYNYKVALSSRMLWALYYRDRQFLYSALAQFERYRTYLQQEGYGEAGIGDYIAVYVYGFISRVSKRENSMFEGESAPEIISNLGMDVVLYGEEDILPEWCAEVVGLSGGLLDSVPFSTSACFIYLLALNAAEYDLFSSAYLDVGEGGAHAFAAGMLYELRRMMPFGEYWFAKEAVDNITTNIGSLLYAESSLYVWWYLAYCDTLNAVSPLQAFGGAGELWYKYLLPAPAYLTSTTRRRELLKVFLDNRHPTTDEDIVAFCQNFFSVSSSVLRYSPPSFLRFSLPYATEDSALVYSSTPTTLGKYFTYSDFLACLYRRVNGKWELRPVAGFPTPSLPAGYKAVTTAEYLEIADPEVNLAIKDEDVDYYIVPLARFTSYFTLRLQGIAPPNFRAILKDYLPAGMYFRVKGLYTSRGEE